METFLKTSCIVLAPLFLGFYVGLSVGSRFAYSNPIDKKANPELYEKMCGGEENVYSI